MNSVSSPTDYPLISIIVPTYDRLPLLRQVLAGLEQQTVPPSAFEVIVVSDGATDGTNEFLHTWKTQLQFRCLFQPNAGVATARNAGVAVSRAELVLFVDDDVVPASDLVAAHLNRHANQRDTIILGTVLTPADCDMSLWGTWEQTMLYRQYRAMEDGHYTPTARQFYTGNVSLPRVAIVEAGGFDPTFRRSEDIDLGIRLARQGLRYVFAPEAKGFHYGQHSFAGWIAIAYAYGANTVVFTRDHEVSWFLPISLQEFQDRNWLLRALIRLLLDRPRPTGLLIGALRRLAEGWHRRGCQTLALGSASCIYGLYFYQGMADQLGGREAFFEQVRLTQQSSSPGTAPREKETGEA